ncbi:alpha-galactosidase [Phenylobacterium aquaticum]|uniref:alpha-galactosidase n=1 Tax=Phenylobacterium aquaticum TaxID=1763816 RepID=UPI001F5DC329|nr:alpha-galactosidase [Phenylobacterium aquaticum]MCI3131931.1 alpha-galactosidase [Phenylobacterium aquaticum]
MLRLDGGGQTLLIWLDGGRPKLAYWGPILPQDLDDASVIALAETTLPQGGVLDLGEALDLFPEAGVGFTGHPALIAHRAGGGFVTQMRAAGYVAAQDEIEIDLTDPLAGLAVRLIVRLDPDTGVAAFRAVLTNTGADVLSVDWISPCALPFAEAELMFFEGRWAREFQTVRQQVRTGLVTKDNRTGRTSHHAPPFMAVGAPGFSETRGEVTGVHLAWSGDARMLAERLRDGRVQVQAGELFLPGEITLPPAGTYETPILYAARSAAGLNGLSDRFHPFVRDQVLGGRLKAKPRPVHFNTWEAVYFDHDLDQLKALADLAASVGAERFILDDGWFKGRNDDTTSLGDWTTDPVKFPGGLSPLIDHVRGLGLEFGLWVEPEMANLDSDLIRAHPDWILHVEGRDQPVGRGQYVLDLTRPEVADNIFAQIEALLAAYPISYLKWDMNRDLTHPASRGRPASHNQTRAVYALIDRLRAMHPDVEIESCASGGGRADYEILKRTDRVWTSDCNDPIERQSIQRGFSIFFPPEVMGAHVGPAASHTTARRTSLMLRAYTALVGHMGIEADVRAFSEADRARLAEAIVLHKRLRPLLHSGRTRRQDYPDPGAVATLVLGRDGGLASFAQLETPPHGGLAPLRLTGLEPAAVYDVTLLNARPARPGRPTPALVRGEPIRTSGRLIAELGLPLPILRAGEIALFELVRVA